MGPKHLRRSHTLKIYGNITKGSRVCNRGVFDFVNINRLAAEFADGLSIGQDELSADLREIFDNAECEKLDYVAEEHHVKEVSTFLDKVIEAEVLI